MAFNYQEMAKTELSRHGIFPEGLIESHPNQLKRLALDYDMGEVSFQSPVASQLAENAPGDNTGRMKAFSEALVEEATFSFPPKADYFGVDVSGKMGASIGRYLIENDIKRDAIVLGIPKEHMSERVYASAVQANPDFIKHVPSEFQDRHIQMTAAKGNPDLIREMAESKDFKLDEHDYFALAAHEGVRLRHFPEDQQTSSLRQVSDMAIYAAINRGDIDPMLIDKRDITEYVAMAMVHNQPASIQRVPEEFLTGEVYAEAIKSGGENALAYIDDKITNPGIDYDDMSELQQAVADAIEERNGFESLLEYAIEQDPMAISGIPSEYQKSLIETQDLVKIAGHENADDPEWIRHVDRDLFKRTRYDNESNDLRKTDAAYQVMAANPNLIGEMFNAGILDEKNPGDVKAAGYILGEGINPDFSPHVGRPFDGGIEDIPAAVWLTSDAKESYLYNVSEYSDVSNEVMRFEAHTGQTLSNSEKAEIVSKDPEILGADVFKEIRESAAASLMADEDGLSQVKRFALEVDMGERSAEVRQATEGEDAMLPYAEAFLQDSDNRDLAEEYILDAGKRLDLENSEIVQEVANGNVDAYLVHEDLKSGELQVGDMNEQQMELMKDINWKVEVSETFEGYSLDEAMLQASPGDSSWMSSMERNATVEMESAGGLKLEFGIQSESRNEYQNVETLRDFYDCNMTVDSAVIGDPLVQSDVTKLAETLSDQWVDAAQQEIGQIPAEYEAIADRTLSDLAIDETMYVSRDNLDEIAISFSVEDPYRDGGVDFTMKAGDPESLTFVGQEPSEAGMSLAETYVAENQEMLAAEIDSFKLQEVGLSNVELDYELIEGTQAHFVTFDNQGEPGSVGLDSETLKLDSSSHGYDKLSEAQVEVLSEKVGKLTEGMTPPMGLEMAERKAEELGELTGNKFHVTDYSDDPLSDETGYAAHEVIDVGGDSVRTIDLGSYESAKELNQALDAKISEAREGLSIERDEPKQEVERERHEEEPERRRISM